jgi:ligand-binding sensor domain-containing protein/anti-sigma regulatory factor (Ser/Thr protein kinase)
MLVLKKFFFAGFICCTSVLSFAQKKSDIGEDKFRAIHWTVNEGLAHDQVSCMLKDSFGFLWIGTPNGLSRFDGSTFKNFFYDPTKKQGIVGPKIWSLVEDSLHNIWIGTDKGLSRYDRKTDTLSNFSPSYKNPTFSTFIIPFWATQEEIFCQETDSFITSYNVHNLARRIVIKLIAADSVTTDRYSPQSFIFDKSSNSIWLRRDSRTAGLLQIFLLKQKRVCYAVPSGESMCYDAKRNSIWTNTDGGLVEFNLNDKQLHRSQALKELARKDITGHIGIDLDPSGRVWFYTHQKGILIYDPADESVYPVFEKDSVSQKDVAEANSCIYCDRDGLTWIGAWLRFGVYQLIPFSQVVKSYNASISNSRGLHTNNIWNIIRGERGKMWMGTGEGLSVYDISRDTFETFHEKIFPGPTRKYWTPIFLDAAHKKAWLADDEEVPGNIYEMDIETMKCKPIVFKDSLNNPVVPNISLPVHYKNGVIIAGNYNKQQCIFIVNGESNVAKQVLSFPDGFINYHMIISTPVSDHLLFLRRPDGMGNLTYADNTGTWARTNSPMDSLPWTIVKYNPEDSSYWVVALRQLFHYDRNFSLVKKYTTEDGLPLVEIYGLIQDNKGNIWFNTHRSIYQLNTKTNQVSILSENDGLQSLDLRNIGEGIAKDDNGDLYFTTAGIFNGFKRVSPVKFISPLSQTYIKSLAIKEFSLPPSTGANNIQQLSLKYFQNRINIETGTIDYYSQGKNRIRYKLEREGVQENWQYAPANYTIRYEELPPGKYTLQIQASNAGNEFIGPIKTILLQISPAFWNTWWFRIGATVLVFTVFYILIRYLTQQRFKLRLERTGKEKQIAALGQKTAELHQQKIEMEMQALRAQMNPHFIFNSLNSINRFILQNNRAQASEYLTKFSKLVRMILQNSQAPLISLESELESLNLYLDLEAVRFEHRFAYKISYPKELDIEVLKVPPLVIQPFTENAIWHGLMHREDKGQLDIAVSEENDYLYIKITDNGIGRKKAAEFANKSATKHKSMGLRITKDRIAMLQKTNGGESPVKIIDLENEDGSAAGTEVIIKIPVINN